MKKILFFVIPALLFFFSSTLVKAATPEDFSGYPYVKSCSKSNPNDVFLNYCLYSNENHEVFLFSEGIYFDYFGYFDKSNKTLYYDYDGIITSHYFTSNNGGSSYSEQSKSVSSKYFNSNGFTCLHCDFPAFPSKASAENYYLRGIVDNDAYIPDPPVPEFDPYNNDYSDDIPAPEIYRDGDKIMFSNSSPDMLLLANIRWYSVDDITLYKESLSWKYRPDSIIHSNLEWLLTVADHYPSVNGVNLYDLGVQSFQEFLSAYPVEGRTYLGGTNALGNYLFGYNDALSSLKMILGQIDSSFNAPELFFRYYVPLADGTYKCGKWTKYSRSLPSGASDGAIDGRWNVQYQVSDSPLTSDDVIGSKPYDTTGMTTYTSKDNTVVVDFDSPNYTLSIDNLNQITSLFGQFPSFVSTVFSFLPSWILSLIGCTITLLVGLAVYHALRG